MNSPHRLSRLSAISLVIANMIGTGVFTSLGFQLLGIQSPLAILLLWFVGGVIALCGALVYGELGAAMPRSGGEYHYLTKLYHPLIGFLSGWVSALIGFSAPVAAAAVAMGSYVHSVYPGVKPVWVALTTVIIITGIHATDLRLGSKFQNFFTVLKVLLILIFIVCGLSVSDHIALDWSFTAATSSQVFSGSFAVSLIYVSYAYSGWNAAAYIAGEMKSPQKDLPRALLYGTAGVMVMYILLNFVFLYTAPIAEMAGVVDIGHVSANYIFGTQGGKMVSMVIALLLISSISSMIIAGPRVSATIGEDFPMMKFIAYRNAKHVPVYAVILQSIISIGLIVTGTFEDIILYVGFTLSLFTLLTVAGIFIFRANQPNIERPYKTWGYPVTPIIFLCLTLWTLFYTFINHFIPSEGIK
jgi:APA family basic amino acid/polyamine antiporter